MLLADRPTAAAWTEPGRLGGGRGVRARARGDERLLLRSRRAPATRDRRDDRTVRSARSAAASVGVARESATSCWPRSASCCSAGRRGASTGRCRVRLVAAIGWASYILFSRRTGQLPRRRRPRARHGGRHVRGRAARNRDRRRTIVGARALADPASRWRCSRRRSRSASRSTPLRSVGPRTFGVVMSTSPAVAAVMGWLVLHETLGPLQAAAIVWSSQRARHRPGDQRR